MLSNLIGKDRMLLSLEQGAYLVKLARITVEGYLKTGRTPKQGEIPTWLKEDSGVFVTLRKVVLQGQHELRGCIGYPEPIMPLYKALVSCAIAAAIEDPRFPPLKENELESTIVEVSVLTKPERLDVTNRSELPKVIKVGRDGLIASRGLRKGLLLPQVPVEEGWDAEEFLTYTCLKAGLPADSWLDEDTEFYRFTAQVFGERSPDGDVEALEGIG